MLGACAGCVHAGHMPWKFGEALEQSGITIINDKADDTCHVDRRLMTGAGPKAANNFGRLAATKMLEAFSGSVDKP